MCLVRERIRQLDHRDKVAVDASKAVGANVFFLLPYSTKFNPIEKLSAKLQTLVRRDLTDAREKFDDALARATTALTRDDFLG